MDKNYAAGDVENQVRQFKQQWLGRTDIPLHTADMTRNKNGYERLKDAAFRQDFYGALNRLMESLEYQVVACAIRKEDHLQKYDIGALDPYFLSLEVLAERLCFEVGNREHGGHIVAESREPTLDRQLEIAWLNLKVQGTRFLKPVQFNHRIGGLALRNKKHCIAGLELADLVVSPIGRHVMGKQAKEDFRIVEKKFRRDRRGNYLGPGLVVLPKKKWGQDPLRSSQPTSI